MSVSLYLSPGNNGSGGFFETLFVNFPRVVAQKKIEATTNKYEEDRDI